MCVDWIHQTKDRDQGWDLTNTIIQSWVMYNADYVLKSRATISFSRRIRLHGVC
jgi:hypothetical protein